MFSYFSSFGFSTMIFHSKILFFYFCLIKFAMAEKESKWYSWVTPADENHAQVDFKPYDENRDQMIGMENFAFFKFLDFEPADYFIEGSINESKILETDICREQTLDVRVQEKSTSDYKSILLEYLPSDMLEMAVKSEVCTEGNFVILKYLFENPLMKIMKKCFEEITLQTEKDGELYNFHSKYGGNQEFGWKLRAADTDKIYFKNGEIGFTINFDELKKCTNYDWLFLLLFLGVPASIMLSIVLILIFYYKIFCLHNVCFNDTDGEPMN